MGTSKKHGKYIETPKDLWKHFEAFVKQEAKSPMYKTEYVGKEGTKVRTPLEVPIIFVGFELYLADQGIINDLGDYSSNKGGAYSDYSTIITRIRSFCFNQNFKGAAVGLFNANLIARKLGLMDKTQIETKDTSHTTEWGT